MAKRKTLNVFTLLLIVATLFGVAIPVPVAHAGTETYNHIIPFTITDTSGVARTNVPVIINFDVDGNLVTYGLTNATCTNTYMDSSGAGNSPIGSGTAYDYLMATDNITVVIPSLPAYGSVTINLYTGYSPLQTSFYTIVGEDGYITIADNASGVDKMELGDNFTVEMKGWVETTFSDNYSNRNLIYKQDAFKTYVSSAGNITAEIVVTTPETLRPDGAGDEENIADSTSGVGLHWQDVNDDPINDATKVIEDVGGYNRDLYTLADHSVGKGTITQIEVFARGESAAAANSNLKTAIKINGTVYEGNEETMTAPGWVNYPNRCITKESRHIGIL